MKKVVLVGYGSMGKNHARVISSNSKLELLGVIDPKENLKNGSSKIFLDKLENILNLKPDYCVIATPSDTHLEICKRIIEMKVNILLEKPATNSLKSAITLSNLIKSSKIKVGIGYIERFNSAVLHAKQLLKKDILGDLYAISIVREGPFNGRVKDVGVTIDLASHDIDLIHFLTKSKFKKIYAEVIKKYSNKNEDALFLLGNLERDISVSLRCNWISSEKKRVITLLGSRGILEINLIKNEVFYREIPKFVNNFSELAQVQGGFNGQELSFGFEKFEPLYQEHQVFYKFIQGTTETFPQINDAIKVHRIIKEIYRSISSGKSIKING